MRISAAALLLMTTAASAQTAAPAPDGTAPTPASPPPEKIICVRTPAETGSHLGAQKVCHTESQWAMIHSQTERTLEQYKTQDSTRAPAGGR